jgi:lipoprotein-releasing system permease protein
MFTGLEWEIAARYLRARREGFISVIAWLSLIGIALGVATLIIVMSVMNGFRADLIERILGISGHLIVQSSEGPVRDYEQITRDVGNADGVVRATPIIEGQAMAMAKGAASGALVRGVRPEDLASNRLIAAGVSSGTLGDFHGTNALVLGGRLARTLGVGVGDQVTLVAPQTTPTAFGTVPRMKSYKVVATFGIGMFEYDSSFIFMPLEAAQIFFRMQKMVSAVEVLVDDPEKLDGPMAAIRAIVPDVRLFDWRQANRQFFNALKVERNVMFLILMLIILVAAMNVISSMIMLVKDKRGDIAILRTMGAPRIMILRIFFMAGASVGVIGTIAGVALGLGFSLNIEAIRRGIEGLFGTQLFAPEVYFLSQLPAKVDPGEVLTIVAMALILSFAATLYPSWRAARTDPVEVLRGE